jgi:hypothetical protein
MLFYEKPLTPAVHCCQAILNQDHTLKTYNNSKAKSGIMVGRRPVSTGTFLVNSAGQV